jgi:hypothetical protein
LLGIRIDRKLNGLFMSWEEHVEMNDYARYWTTFGLNLAGRIMAARTYLILQSIYFDRSTSKE